MASRASILDALRISLGILLLLPTLAAGQNGPKIQPRPHEAPVVRLLEAGKEPLAPLRYALKGPQQVTIVANGGMEVSKDGQTKALPMPTLTMPVRLQPESGKVAFEWLKGSFETSPQDTQTAHIISALEGSTGQLLIADGRGVITNILLRATPKDPAIDGKLQMRTIAAMEMGKGVLAVLEVPLPEEKLGVGGKWQVERVAQRGMISFRLIHTFTVVSRKGNLVELSYRFGGGWEPGSGLREEEVKVGVSGGGTCTLDLTLPLPVRVDDDITVKAAITAPDGQQTFQTTRVGTHVESK